MKREKRDPDGQPHRIHVHRSQVEHAQQNVQVAHHEVGVLEERERPDVQRHRHTHRPFPPRDVGLPIHPSSQKIIQQGGAQHQEDEDHLAPGIENHAEGQQQGVAQLQSRKRAHRQYDRQEQKQK